LQIANALDAKSAGKGKKTWTCSYIVRKNSQVVDNKINYNSTKICFFVFFLEKMAFRFLSHKKNSAIP
jgi:hypothetical protein